MKRILSMVGTVALLSSLTACGDVTSVLDAFLPGADMSATGDMAQIQLFRLPPGVWKVSGPVTMITDDCMVKPNDPDVAGGFPMGLSMSIWGLTNDAMGNIKLGNTDKPAMPAMPQIYDVAESGVPPQPALGASCPGTGNPAQCATEATAKPFNNNIGTLVRDNDINTMGPQMCTFHRHIVNQVNLTADGKLTAQYTRTDSKKTNCLISKTDCTTKWSWDLEFVKEFGK